MTRRGSIPGEAREHAGPLPSSLRLRLAHGQPVRALNAARRQCARSVTPDRPGSPCRTPARRLAFRYRRRAFPRSRRAFPLAPCEPAVHARAARLPARRFCLPRRLSRAPLYLLGALILGPRCRFARMVSLRLVGCRTGPGFSVRPSARPYLAPRLRPACSCRACSRARPWLAAPSPDRAPRDGDAASGSGPVTRGASSPWGRGFLTVGAVALAACRGATSGRAGSSPGSLLAPPLGGFSPVALGIPGCAGLDGSRPLRHASLLHATKETAGYDFVWPLSSLRYAILFLTLISYMTYDRKYPVNLPLPGATFNNSPYQW